MHRLQVANRIDLLLRRSLGQGVDVGRVLDEPLYARDVLLVCDAMPGTELATLARMFRSLTKAEQQRAGEPAPEVRGERASGWMSGWSSLSTGFGPSEPAPEAPEQEPRRTAGRSSRWPWPFR